MGAEDAQEALRDDPVQCRDEIIGLHAHMDESPDDVQHVVGVDRCQYQVPCQCRLNGDLSRFRIPNFSDHNLVWVVSQDRTQPAGKRQAFLFVDGNLQNPRQLIFHRIFDRDDFVLALVQLVEHGIERGRFPAPRRACDQHQSVGLGGEPADLRHRLLVEADHIQPEPLTLLR